MLGTYVMGLFFWANVAPICAVKMPFPTRIVLYRCALLNEVIAVTAMSFGSQGVDRYCPAAVLLCARALSAAAAGRVHAERDATRCDDWLAGRLL